MGVIHPFHVGRRRLGIFFICLGVVLGAFAIGILLTSRQKIRLKPPVGAATSEAAPSSAKLPTKSIASYTVPAEDPKYIAVPAIGIGNTPIVRLGLNGDGAIRVPGNIYQTGWYSGSARPGRAGAMFLYGHVSSWTANGVFYNLKKLAPGAMVTIVRGDNKPFTYKVISTKVYPYNNVDMSQVLAPIDSQAPGLNLMTCTGQIIKGTSEFDERLVVFTSLVGS